MPSSGQKRSLKASYSTVSIYTGFFFSLTAALYYYSAMHRFGRSSIGFRFLRKGVKCFKKLDTWNWLEVFVSNVQTKIEKIEKVYTFVPLERYVAFTNQLR